MHNLTFKKAVPIIVFSLFLILIATLSLSDLKQKREEEAIYQKFLQEQLAQKQAEEKNYLLGQFDPSAREDFVLVSSQYAISGMNEMYLRKETFDAFLKMQAAASKDFLDLKIASATRNFDYQRGMWNDEWTGVKLIDGKNLAESFPDGLDRFKKILEYTAVPGTSRHHWGTEIDINGANTTYFENERGLKEYLWLVKNAPSFGFCQTYRAREIDRRTGYNEEKWHWSYLPLSRPLTEEYKNLITERDIKRFFGDEYVKNFNLINNYVLDINPECL